MPAPESHPSSRRRRPGLHLHPRCHSPPPPGPPSPAKSNSKLLYVFLKGVVMVVLSSCFFLFVGFGAVLVLLLNLCPAYRHRRRPRDPDESEPWLSPEDLRRLPRTKLGYGPRESAEECVVCLSNSTGGEWWQTLPDCGHKFHAKCIDTWLVKAAICPTCRRPVRLDGGHCNA